MKKLIPLLLFATSVMSASAFSLKETVKTIVTCEVCYLAYNAACKMHVIDSHIPSLSITVDGKTYVIFKGKN